MNIDAIRSLCPPRSAGVMKNPRLRMNTTMEPATMPGADIGR
jgi:hypothetical protein